MSYKLVLINYIIKTQEKKYILKKVVYTMYTYVYFLSILQNIDCKKDNCNWKKKYIDYKKDNCDNWEKIYVCKNIYVYKYIFVSFWRIILIIFL